MNQVKQSAVNSSMLRNINHLEKVFVVLNFAVNFQVFFHPLRHQLEKIPATFQHLVVEIEDSSLLTFRVEKGAYKTLPSMNVHLIVNQIKVQDEQQIYSIDFPCFDWHRAW